MQIFEPAGRSVRLTSTGEEIVAAARAALDDVDQVFAVAHEHVGDLDTLVVVTTPTLEPLFARHFLPEYYTRRPGPSARVLRAAGHEEVASILLAGEAMVGLSDLPVPDGLVVVPLGQFEVVLLSPPGSELPAEIDLVHARRRPADTAVDRHDPTGGSSTRSSTSSTSGPLVALESDERGSWLEGVVAGIGAVLWYGERATDAIDRGTGVSHFSPPLHRSIGLCHLPGGSGPRPAALLELAQERSACPAWAHT